MPKVTELVTAKPGCEPRKLHLYQPFWFRIYLKHFFQIFRWMVCDVPGRYPYVFLWEFGAGPPPRVLCRRPRTPTSPRHTPCLGQSSVRMRSSTTTLWSSRPSLGAPGDLHRPSSRASSVYPRESSDRPPSGFAGGDEAHPTRLISPSSGPLGPHPSRCHTCFPSRCACHSPTPQGGACLVLPTELSLLLTLLGGVCIISQ